MPHNKAGAAARGQGNGSATIINRASVSISSTVPLCDFCAEPRPVGRYLARPFVRSVPGSTVAVEFDAHWAACDACHRLIKANDWARLLRRYRRLHAHASDPAVYTELAALWQTFARRRTGPAVRIGGGR